MDRPQLQLPLASPLVDGIHLVSHPAWTSGASARIAPHDRFDRRPALHRSSALATYQRSAVPGVARLLGHDRDHALGLDTSPLADRRGHEFDVAGPAGRSSPGMSGHDRGKLAAPQSRHSRPRSRAVIGPLKAVHREPRTCGLQADQANLIPQRLGSNPGSGTSTRPCGQGFRGCWGRAPQCARIRPPSASAESASCVETEERSRRRHRAHRLSPRPCEAPGSPAP